MVHPRPFRFHRKLPTLARRLACVKLLLPPLPMPLPTQIAPAMLCLTLPSRRPPPPRSSHFPSSMLRFEARLVPVRLRSDHLRWVRNHPPWNRAWPASVQALRCCRIKSTALLSSLSISAPLRMRAHPLYCPHDLAPPLKPVLGAARFHIQIRPLLSRTTSLRTKATSPTWCTAPAFNLAAFAMYRDSRRASAPSTRPPRVPRPRQHARCCPSTSARLLVLPGLSVCVLPASANEL